MLKSSIATLELYQNTDWFVQLELINLYLPKMKIEIYEEGQLKRIDFNVRLSGEKFIFKMRLFYRPVFNKNVQMIQPILFCLNEDIERDIDNHISKSGSICYFFPGDMSHVSGISCLYCIQCAIKWCDCYSFWLKNKSAGWPGKEMPHGSYFASRFDILRPSLV